MASIPRAAVKVEMTPEMIEAMQAAYEGVTPHPYRVDGLVAAYRAARALEHGEADPGVMQHPGVSPYAVRR